jgi:hypothetical protein
MDGFLAWVDQAIVNMRAGMAAGVVPPAILMERTLPQLEAHIVADVEQSVFYKPVVNFPAAVSEMSARECERLMSPRLGIAWCRPMHGSGTSFAESICRHAAIPMGWERSRTARPGMPSPCRSAAPRVFYEDQYQRFCQLNAELWRATCWNLASMRGLKSTRSKLRIH